MSRPNGSFCFFSQAAAELHEKEKKKKNKSVILRNGHVHA